MRKFDPRHMDRLLSPERRRSQDPELVLDNLGVVEGMTVADIGTGPGFFTLPAARRVGPAGKVYAVDIEPAMLEQVRERATAEGITNVEAVLSREDRLPLPTRVVDVALLADVLHELLEPGKLLEEIARVLKPGGALAVVEWKKEQQEWGPPLEERLAPEQAEALLREADFDSFEPFEVGPNHYGILARNG